ncbi:hypothetical protein SAMN05880501_104262 [Ureibacillus xyleni]|uniref:Uncharacterized protein n=1 Tax=Ureibacillus xyleni TaxID=614648 RepID=A0A285SJQ0_9BACL|nr:hypothetical protein [Ureibacillus xyleni]SOC06373.1 hypothetical protein SAMN05880501_104262 [Ureibacillus xyleni]
MYIIWCILVLILAYISSYLFGKIKFRTYLLFGLLVIILIAINSIFLTIILFTIAAFLFIFKRVESPNNPIETTVLQDSPTYVETDEDRPDFKEYHRKVDSHKVNRYVRSSGYTASSLNDNHDEDEYERDRFELEYDGQSYEYDYGDRFDSDYEYDGDSGGYENDYNRDRYDYGDSGSGSDW